MARGVAKSLISGVVKPGNRSDNVKNLQLLLRAAALFQSQRNNDNTLVKAAPSFHTKQHGLITIQDRAWADGDWGLGPASPTTIALHTFQKMAGIPITNQVATNDITVLRLAEQAGILIDLSLRSGISGLKDLNSVLSDVTYEPGADTKAGSKLNCSFYGLEGRTEKVVQWQNGCIQPGPIYMNCTTYANLALSIYVNGNAQNSQYDPDVHEIGDEGPHLAVNYGFAIMDRKDAKNSSAFLTANEIKKYAQPDRLYSIEWALALDDEGHQGYVHHEAILYDKTVYHSWPNGKYSLPTIMSQSLEEFETLMKTRHNGYFYVLQEPRAGDSIFTLKSEEGHKDLRILVTAA